jgi:hypothetical protein
MSFETFGVPDWLILEWNSNAVISTGYRGTANYDYGGVTRTSFINSLVGKVDPIYNTTYPDTTNYPLDGYPRVSLPTNGTLNFNKNLSSPTNATLKVYSPLTGTDWNATISCPGGTTTTTSTTTTTTTAAPSNFSHGILLCEGGTSTVISQGAELDRFAYYYHLSIGCFQVASAGTPTASPGLSFTSIADCADPVC